MRVNYEPILDPKDGSSFPHFSPILPLIFPHTRYDFPNRHPLCQLPYPSTHREVVYAAQHQKGKARRYHVHRGDGRQARSPRTLTLGGRGGWGLGGFRFT